MNITKKILQAINIAGFNLIYGKRTEDFYLVSKKDRLNYKYEKNIKHLKDLENL